MKEEKVVPLRMNPEPKKDGRKKMRLIVKGFLEPASWDDKTDSPTAMSSTIRQLVAMGAPLRIVDGESLGTYTWIWMMNMMLRTMSYP